MTLGGKVSGWRLLQQLGAYPGAAGGRLLHGGPIVKHGLFPCIWVRVSSILHFPLASSTTELCSGSHFLGGRLNPRGGHNDLYNPSLTLPAPCSKSSSVLFGQSPSTYPSLQDPRRGPGPHVTVSHWLGAWRSCPEEAKGRELTSLPGLKSLLCHLLAM